jgi:hypothetical protein
MFAKLKLEKITAMVETRTDIYARLMRRYGEVDQTNNWVEISGVLPKTKAF